MEVVMRYAKVVVALMMLLLVPCSARADLFTLQLDNNFSPAEARKVQVALEFGRSVFPEFETMFADGRINIRLIKVDEKTQLLAGVTDAGLTRVARADAVLRARTTACGLEVELYLSSKVFQDNRSIFDLTHEFYHVWQKWVESKKSGRLDPSFEAWAKSEVEASQALIKRIPAAVDAQDFSWTAIESIETRDVFRARLSQQLKEEANRARIWQNVLTEPRTTAR